MITKKSKELICKEYFTIKEPARAQKANDSLLPLCPQKNQRLRGVRVAWARKNGKIYHL